MSLLSRIFIWGIFFTIGLGNPLGAQEKSEQQKNITYAQHVRPILVQRCASCHSDNRKEGDLDVTNYTNLMIGGGSGEVVSSGSATDSYLYNLITHDDSPEMPPSGNKIPDEEIDLIARWINGGVLENSGSQPRRSKPKIDLSLDTTATVRPETVAMPMHVPRKPIVATARPSVTALATSPWAALTAIATPKQILLYQTESLELLGVLPLVNPVHDLHFSRNGSLLLAGGGKAAQNGNAILWDVKTGQTITTIGDELDSVLAADIRSDQQQLAFGGPSKKVKVFAVADGTLQYEIDKHTDWVTAIQYSPDGKYLATGDRNGSLYVWESATGNELLVLNGHKEMITGISWRSDSKVLASSSEDQSIQVWESQKGKQLKSWEAHRKGTTGLEFLRNGQLLTCGRDQQVKLWQQDGKLLHKFKGLNDIAVAVSGCDESGRMVGADWTGQVLVWDGKTAKIAGKLSANPATERKK